MDKVAISLKEKGFRINIKFSWRNTEEIVIVF